MKKKYGTYVVLCVICIVGIWNLSAQEKIDGPSVLKKVDEYREYSKTGFSFNFSITESDGTASRMRVYLENSRRDISLVRYLEPKKYRRRVVLTIGNSFYVYDHGMASPVRITPREMLFGQASAGDITRIAFSGMYSIEQITEHSGVYDLILKAIPDKGVTYDRIDLRVSATTSKPLKAECRGTSGTLLKEITYNGFSVIEGKELLSGFTIVDSTNGDSSTVVLDGFSAETYPSSNFTVEAMKYVR